MSCNKLPMLTIAESLVWVKLFVVDEPRQVAITERALRIDADVIAFDGADEGFSHSIALRAFDGRRSRFKPDVASEAAGITLQCSSRYCRTAIRW
jgi:hypothetical protein